jgi:hypothetical protein
MTNDATEAPQATTQDDPPILRLTRLQFWSFFVLLLGVFLFARGPVWKTIGHVSTLNDAILWSYAPIPLLVAGGLRFKHRLTWRAMVLDTLELTILKFVVTYSFSMILWGALTEPEHADSRPTMTTAAMQADVPLAHVPEAVASRIDLNVTDAQGHGLEGAIAWVSAGLDKRYAPSSKGVVVTSNGEGVSPRLVIAQAGQQLLASSSDGKLHTLVATLDGNGVLNAPLLPAGVPNAVMVPQIPGGSEALELVCSVHRHLGTERAATFVITDSPFFGTSVNDGGLRIDGAPAGDLKVTVRALGYTPRTVDVTTHPAKPASIKVALTSL